MGVPDFNNVVSTVRFIKNHSLLNLLKIAYISLYLNFTGIYLVYAFYIDAQILTFKSGVLLFAFTSIACAGYMFLQNKTLKIRRKEIFMRKWYGGKTRHIFALLITEHLIITGISALISFVTVDFMILFANSTLHILPVISNYYGQSFYFHLYMAAAISMFVGCIALTIRKWSKAYLSDVLVKIS